jgi:hypothetical protein
MTQGRSSPSRRQTTRSIPSVVAALGLAGGLIMGCTTTPTPTTEPSVQPAPAGTPPSPSIVVPSHAPSPSPPTEPTTGVGAWERIDYSFPFPVILWDLWTVDDHFVAIAERDTADDPGYVFLSSENARDWHAASAPSDFAEIYYRTGTVVDGRLWFIARVHGEPNDTRQLVSTETGDTWERLGPARRLGARDGSSFLIKVGDRWFAAPRRETPSEPFAIVDQDIRTSGDGVEWSVVDAPRFGVMTQYTWVGRIGEEVLVSGVWHGDEVHERFFMTSTTGRTWSAADLQPARYTSPGEFACSPTTCVLVGSITDDDGNYDHPFAWHSDDGLTWAAAEPKPPFPPERVSVPMGEVVWTGSEFVAVGGDGGDAWLSVDGVSWRYVEVIAREAAEPIQALGVVGDRIVGLYEPGDSSGRLSIWVGSLAAMAAAR